MSELAIQRMHSREKRHKLPNGKMASEYREALFLPEDQVRVFTTAYDWRDKPHRLVYDLLRCLDIYKMKIDRLERKLREQANG